MNLHEDTSGGLGEWTILVAACGMPQYQYLESRHLSRNWLWAVLEYPLALLAEDPAIFNSSVCPQA